MSELVKRKILPEIVVSTTLEFRKNCVPLNAILKVIQEEVGAIVQVAYGEECCRIKFSVPVDIVDDSTLEKMMKLEKIIRIIANVSALAVLAKAITPNSPTSINSANWQSIVANSHNRNERASRNQRQTHRKGS